MTEPYIESQKNKIELNRTHACRVVFRSELPVATLVADFLTFEECEKLIEYSRPRVEHSEIVSSDGSAEVNQATRSSYGISHKVGENELISEIERRISILCNWEIEQSTGLQTVRYLPGDSFVPHFDFFAPAVLEKTGERQRVATILIYLNDVDIGGQTHFPDAGVAIAPQRGSALFFSYSTPNRSTMTYHAGIAPESGEKWVAVKWLLK